MHRQQKILLGANSLKPSNRRSVLYWLPQITYLSLHLSAESTVRYGSNLQGSRFILVFAHNCYSALSLCLQTKQLDDESQTSSSYSLLLVRRINPVSASKHVRLSKITVSETQLLRKRERVLPARPASLSIGPPGTLGCDRQSQLNDAPNQLHFLNARPHPKHSCSYLPLVP